MNAKRLMSLTGFLFVGSLAAVISFGCEETGGFATESEQATAEREIDPRIPPKTHFAAGRLLERRGDFEGAIKQYRRAIALSADYVDALNRLGVTLDRVGRFDEADAYFTEAIILQPGKAYLRNNLAFSYMLQRRWEDAEAELRNALVLDPDFERARVNLGLVLARQERFEDAMTAFILALPPADAYYNMGLIYREHDLFAEAQEAFNRSLVLDPSMEAARKQLESIETRLAAIEAQRQQQRKLAEEREFAARDAAKPLDSPAVTWIDPTTPVRTTDAATIADPQDDIAIDPACDEEMTRLMESIVQSAPSREPIDPTADWDAAIAASDDESWTIPSTPEPASLSLATTLLLNEHVHDAALSAVREVMAINAQLALAEESRRAMRQSAPIDPIHEPVNDLISEPSVSADPIPTAIAKSKPIQMPLTMGSSTLLPIDPLDGLASVDGPTAGRVSLLGYVAPRIEGHAGPVRQVNEQRQTALAKYNESESAPLAPHEAAVAAKAVDRSPNDRLPNRAMKRTAGACQCTDHWKDPFTPKE